MRAIFSRTHPSAAAEATPIRLHSETAAKQFAARLVANVQWVKQFLHRAK